MEVTSEQEAQGVGHGKYEAREGETKRMGHIGSGILTVGHMRQREWKSWISCMYIFESITSYFLDTR